MNFIERVLIEKAGHENGFENVLTSKKELVLLGSARHRAQALPCQSVTNFERHVKEEQAKYAADTLSHRS